ncbi:hypothetical protein HanRHA438_Chr15g0692971 [Helianthus annuus]|nr:hypothetical protein HanRHA438_Chr15g0692971 [Helianthus annuus]
MEKPARSPTGRPWWWLTATVTAVASRIPSRVPVSLIGRSRDRMGNLKVILNNRNVRVATVPGMCSFSTLSVSPPSQPPASTYKLTSNDVAAASFSSLYLRL